VAPIGVAQRHGAAIHIDLVAVELEVADEFLGNDARRPR